MSAKGGQRVVATSRGVQTVADDYKSGNIADYFKCCQGNQRPNKTVARLVSQFEMKQCFQM
jgi:hypothetical protein